LTSSQNAIISGDPNQLSNLLSTATPEEKENALIWALSRVASLYAREDISNMLEQKLTSLTPLSSSPPSSLYPSLASFSSYSTESTSSTLVFSKNNLQQQKKRQRGDTDSTGTHEPPAKKQCQRDDEKSEQKLALPLEKKSYCQIM